MDIDRELRDRLVTECEAAVRRALERAGNRLKGRAGVLRSTLSTTPAMRAAAVAGPNLIADAGLTSDELLDGAWDDVVVRYRKWSGAAYDEATGVVSGVIGEFRTGYPEAMKQTFSNHLDESEVLLRRGLQGIAAEKMLDPKGLDEVGELVPNGFVRHVVARAGGTTDITSTGYAYVALTSDGGPLPGLATGPLLEDALHDHGAAITAFRWVYGPAFRQSPFRPHARLDGVVFTNFDDPKLANTSGFPATAFYIPGDHRGCRCDAEPIVLTPDQAKALGIPSSGDESPSQRRRRERAEAREAAIDAAALEHGVSPDSVRLHMADVKELRAAIAADAAATQERAYGLLQRGHIGKALLPRPPRFGTAARKAGEWDWLDGLSQEERSRLSRSWYLDGPDAAGLDEIADALISEGAADGNWGVAEVMERTWLPLNRQIEAAGSVRRGKLPVAKHYSGAVDVNDLAPNVWADGIDTNYVLSHADEDVAGLLASRASNELEDDAFRMLGGEPVHGEAPWRMGFQSWETEVRDLEWSLRNSPGDVTPSMRARYDELVPLGLDEPGLDHQSLYSVIVETARVGKLDVPATARIPWIDVDDFVPAGYLDDLVRAAEAADGPIVSPIPTGQPAPALSTRSPASVLLDRKTNAALADGSYIDLELEAPSALRSIEDMAEFMDDDWADGLGVRFTRFALEEPIAYTSVVDGTGVSGALGGRIIDDVDLLYGNAPSFYVEYLGSTGIAEGAGSQLTQEMLRRAADADLGVLLVPDNAGAEAFWKAVGMVQDPNGVGSDLWGLTPADVARVVREMEEG